MTVARLLSEISGYELAEWMQYERMFGPLGGYRDDVHAAQISHAIYCLQAGMSGKRPTAKLKDHILTWEPRPPQTPADHLRMVRQLHAGLTKDSRRRKPPPNVPPPAGQTPVRSGERA